ncbi:MAG: sn-glycerol-3-phosphate ABC transporter ATP-binding protein UgpC [Oxalobacteraceae bacterium]|nr:sn-glycerol-3-phosphate ABC transporter ATP-binding protein UgpC [Oxalobacteraceae bacterium]
MADLIFKGIHKRYGTGPDVIRDVNLTIEQGEFCVFVGPSGCGKSTLLRMVAGLEDISGGELLMGGQRMNEKSPTERGVAMVFQSYALYPHMSVYDNMAFGLKILKTSSDTVDKKVREAARILQLEPLLERLPKELSGGQRQRVAIGRAIVRQPQIFLFDEPLSNLDASLRVQTRLEIAKLHSDIGTSSMIYVTHDQVEAMTLANKIVLLNAGDAVLRDGSVAQCGAPLELYHFPVNKFVAGFIGSPKMNFIQGVLEKAEAGVATVRVANAVLSAQVDATDLAPGTPLELGIRPEHTLPTSGERLANTICGKVAFVERLGEASYLYLRLPDGKLITVRESGDTAHKIGELISVYLAPDSLHAFKQDGRACLRTVRIDSVKRALV